MAATPQTDYFVDPALGSDTGDGSVGTPWGRASGSVVQYALTTGITQDTTNGDRINVKAGSDDTVSSALTLATYGTPSEVAPLTIQGYTSAVGDGGIGGISGGGSVAVISSASYNYVGFRDMHLHNCGSAAVVTLNNDCALVHCEIDNTSGAGALLDTDAIITQCHVHNVGGVGVEALDNSLIFKNYLENGTNVFSTAIQVGTGAVMVYRNIINLSGTPGGGDGILLREGSFCMNNSLYCNAGTGQGIVCTTASSAVGAVLNNLVEGWIGAGGVGISIVSTGSVRLYGGNSVQNCTSDYDDDTNKVPDASIDMNLGGSESLSASPFTAAGSDDFEPVDTGSVKEGSLPATFGE